jgi:hypothetical protein
VSETGLQKTVKAAVQKADIPKKNLLPYLPALLCYPPA